MGIYILNRRCLDFVPKGEHFGFDQLVLALLAAGQPIQAFPHAGYWLDLGPPARLRRSQRQRRAMGMNDTTSLGVSLPIES